MLSLPIITYEGDNQASGNLVSAWQVGSGNTSITYVLNSAYRWSNGIYISAADVAFTLKVMQLPYFRSRMAEQYKVIRDVEVIDSLSFRVNFNRPVADPFFHSKFPILPAVWSKYLSDTAKLVTVYQNEFIGCGPFVLVSSSPDSVLLIRNKYYPGGFPRLDRLIIYFYNGDDQLAQRIRGSKADLVVDLPFSMINLIKKTPGYEIRTYPEQGYSFVAWNIKKPILADLSMRRALSMAIDRDALINGVLAGYARKIEGPVYPGLRVLNDSLPQVSYNPQEAERILDEAGWRLDETTGVRKRRGKRLELSLLINRENSIRKELALNIKANLAAIGVKIAIEVADWQKIRQIIRSKDFDALLLTWIDEDNYEPSQIFHSAEIRDGLNMMSYESARADSLIESGLNAMEKEIRERAWSEFQYTVATDLPCTFLFNQEIICGIKNSLHNVSISEKGCLQNAKEWWTSNR